MLEVDPTYLSDTAAIDDLAPLSDAIGEDLEHGRATRRYSLSGDRGALHDIVLCRCPAGAVSSRRDNTALHRAARPRGPAAARRSRPSWRR